MDRTNRRGSRRGELLDHRPPYDFDAERAVSACVLLDSASRIAEVTAAHRAGRFHGRSRPAPFTQRCYGCILPGKPIDVTLFVSQLRDSGQYNTEDGVSAATLVELFRPAPLVRKLPYYVERVAKMSQQRKSLVSKL